MQAPAVRLELPRGAPTPKETLAQSFSMHWKHSVAPYATPNAAMRTLLGATTGARGPAQPSAAALQGRAAFSSRT